MRDMWAVVISVALPIPGFSNIYSVYSYSPATYFRRMFYVYHNAMKHHHTNIIVYLFSGHVVLKCAVKILKMGS